MRHPIPPLSFVCLLTLTIPVARLSAQCPESHGLLAGAPIALSVDDDPGVPLSASTLYHKPQGFLGQQPGTWTSIAGVPDFDPAAAFRVCGVNKMPDIDAMSIGQDWVLADDNTGQVLVPPNRWAVLTVSVTRGTKGRPGSRIETEAMSADGAAADVIQYVLPGSVLPPELIGIPERALDSREIDLGTGAAQRNVDALDHFIPLYRLEPGIVNTMPQAPRFFFSVTNATLGRTPAVWWAGTPPSGATILEMTWDPRVRKWSCPLPFKTFRDLGLDQQEDIDGLGIDLLNQRILLSTTTPTRDPILFVYCGADAATPVPYIEPGGTPVSDKIGLLSGDDVDAICAMDPSVRSATGAPNPMFFLVGTPQTRLFPPSGPVSATAFRDYSAGGVQLHTHVIGWPPATGPGAGFAALFIEFPLIPGPWIPVGMPIPRAAAPVFCGDPQDVVLNVPAILSLTATPVMLRWFVVDQGLTNFGEAHPLLYRL